MSEMLEISPRELEEILHNHFSRLGKDMSSAAFKSRIRGEVFAQGEIVCDTLTVDVEALIVTFNPKRDIARSLEQEVEV